VATGLKTLRRARKIPVTNLGHARPGPTGFGITLPILPRSPAGCGGSLPIHIPRILTDGVQQAFGFFRSHLPRLVLWLSLALLGFLLRWLLSLLWPLVTFLFLLFLGSLFLGLLPLRPVPGPGFLLLLVSLLLVVLWVLALVLLTLLLLLLKLFQDPFEVVLRVDVPGIGPKGLFVGLEAFLELLGSEKGISQVVPGCVLEPRIVGVGGFQEPFHGPLEVLALVKGIPVVEPDQSRPRILKECLQIPLMGVVETPFRIETVSFLHLRTGRLAVCLGRDQGQAQHQTP
jgi:hypothetical protein